MAKTAVEPRVLNKRRDGIPPGAVYVGRPTKWGNPYAIGCHVEGQGRRRMTREDVMVLYAHWLRRQPALMFAARHELRGKDLVCWCAPLPCHADILLEVANGR